MRFVCNQTISQIEKHADTDHHDRLPKQGVWPHSNLSSGGEFDFEIIGMVEAVSAFVPSVAFECQAQAQDAGGSGFRPEHPRLFEALADDGFAAALHHA
jgi:hypothetical protein